METGRVLSACLGRGTQCSVRGRQNQAQQPGLTGTCSLWRPGTRGLAEPWGLHLCANAGSCLGPGACWTQLLRLRQSPPPICGLEFQPGVCGQVRGPRPTPRGCGWPRGETMALFVTGSVAEFYAPFRLHLVEQPCLQVSFLLKAEFPRGQGPVGGARRSCPGVSAGVGTFRRWWHRQPPLTCRCFACTLLPGARPRLCFRGRSLPSALTLARPAACQQPGAVHPRAFSCHGNPRSPSPR